MIYRFRQQKEPEILQNHLHLGGCNPSGIRLDLNSRYFTKDGKPWIPVMGEFHFSRYHKKDWGRELAKMKAGGITWVSTYLFWIYHETIEGEFDFTEDNDIRTFVSECGKAGLDVVLRIGPWVHGECRNGGLPDWLLQKPYPLRTNDPRYLEKVHIWYEKIAEQVKDYLYQNGGNIVAIQLENEYVEDASHLAALKKIALECGLEVPYYTVTGWNSAFGAQIPVEEVVPVFGGYCEAPWEGHTNRLKPSPHYFFCRERNDSAIGADQLIKTEYRGWQLPYEKYPFATCELGGGIQVTHHRRPIIKPMDIYAVALVKLGVGNNLPGYYMYHGGTNKIRNHTTLQESTESGYPNDYPMLSYDFQAPLSEYGEVRGQYRLLNMLHLFLQDFQEDFAPMYAVDAEKPTDLSDLESLRYGMRTNGESGFVFVNHYQRLTKLQEIKGAVFDTGDIQLPPIDVTGEVSFFLPFRMPLKKEDGGAVCLQYALAQPVCRVGSSYFFAEIPGITPMYAFSDGAQKTVTAGLESVLEYEGIRVVTLTWEQAQYLRRLEGEIYLGDGCDLYVYEGGLRSVQEGEYTCYRWNGEEFDSFVIGHPVGACSAVWEEIRTAPFEPPYGKELHMGGKRQLKWKKLVKITGACENAFLCIEEDYDVAQIYADGELVADQYYYGRPWRIPAELLAGKECYLVMSERKDDFYREF